MSRRMKGHPGWAPPHDQDHEEDADCRPGNIQTDDWCEPVGSWRTKDSGQRMDYPSGMRRDVQDGKARFDLIFPEGVPYKDQLLTRFAELLMRGAEKYGENNWQLANSEEELKRFKASALRHMIQWHCGETDEDHATAVIFNLMAYENTKRKLT